MSGESDGRTDTPWYATHALGAGKIRRELQKLVGLTQSEFVQDGLSERAIRRLERAEVGTDKDGDSFDQYLSRMLRKLDQYLKRSGLHSATREALRVQESRIKEIRDQFQEDRVRRSLRNVQERHVIYSNYPLPTALRGRFFGRTRELSRLKNRLLEADPSRVVITGTGGIGKTQLALEFMWCNYDTFTGGVFWLDGSKPSQREAQLHGVLRALLPTTASLDQLCSQGRNINDVLRTEIIDNLQKGPMLWIVDNLIESPAGVPPDPIERWCPAPDSVSLVVTSRQMRLDGELVGLKALSTLR